MNSKLIWLLVVLVVVTLLLVGYLGWRSQNKIGYVYFGQEKVTVEVARTATDMQKGLSGRRSLAVNHGMLFIFNKPQIVEFWMKVMLFPLDFVWINNQKIVDLTEYVSPPLPGVKDSQLITYSPHYSVNAVLEVGAGFASQYHLKIGQSVKIVLSGS